MLVSHRKIQLLGETEVIELIAMLRDAQVSAEELQKGFLDYMARYNDKGVPNFEIFPLIEDENGDFCDKRTLRNAKLLKEASQNLSGLSIGRGGMDLFDVQLDGKDVLKVMFNLPDDCVYDVHQDLKVYLPGNKSVITLGDMMTGGADSLAKVFEGFEGEFADFLEEIKSWHRSVREHYDEMKILSTSTTKESIRCTPFDNESAYFVIAASEVFKQASSVMLDALEMRVQGKTPKEIAELTAVYDSNEMMGMF